MIVLLRDPVARALSHWNMWRVFGGKKGFAEEVADELGAMRARRSDDFFVGRKVAVHSLISNTARPP